jgi:hypothetical protein
MPTAPVVATGLIGGYAAARHAGRSDLATAVFIAVGVWCARSWLRSSGRRVTGILLGTYLVAFWISHPLAKKIGAWPSVLAAAGAAAGTAAVLADHSVRVEPPAPGKIFATVRYRTKITRRPSRANGQKDR